MRFDAKQLQEMSKSVRAHALDAIRHAGSGHVGIVLGAADIITAIYANFLRVGVDRFVLSAGHGSALFYSVLKLAGYKIGDLESFRQIGGLPGHPEIGIDGVWATTGPLGQGIGNAVGMALAAKLRGLDTRVFCLCSDGDLMEGVASEAIAFAGRYKLNNLILVWDDNGLSIDGAALTDMDIPMRMRAAGWGIMRADGDNFNQINRVLSSATDDKNSVPVFVQCKTVLGRDSSLSGQSSAHGFALDDSEMMRLTERFISPCGDDLWSELAHDMTGVQQVEIPKINADNISIPHSTTDMSTREMSGMFVEKLMANGINVVGGSADLGHSTNVKVKSSVDILPPDFVGNYINYGVREHAMGAIMNGMVAGGVRAYGSTFLVFSDYMRASIRIAAMSGLPAIYVFTHDSVAVGPDGPTHQPIEQLPSLRLIPNLNVFRPCNADEVAYAWHAALSDTEHPSAIILSRQKIKQIQTHSVADISRGAYIIRSAKSRRVRVTLVATGAEVPLAISVAEKLGDGVQVVSMPNVGAFRNQDVQYKKKILAGYVVVIEAAATAPWFEFADAVVGIDSFGVSGDGESVYKHFGFDTDAIVRDISKKIR